MQIKRNSRKLENTTFQLENGKTLFYRTGTQASINIHITLGYDAVIIETKDKEIAYQILKTFRSHHNPEFYLKPIFIGHKQFFQDEIVDCLHDGYYYPDVEISTMSTYTWDIFMKTIDLDSRQSISYESEIWKRILGFFHTRSKNALQPVVNTNSLSGYSYAILSQILDRNDQSQLFYLLDWAENQGFITGKDTRKLYVCNECESSFIHIREVCTSCESTDLESVPLVHHFPCAHIAPITDFKQGDHTLSCPKCNKSIRHIGVDYDKPSSVFICKNCQSTSQNPFIKAKCINCSKDNEVSHLVARSIKDYSLTKKGLSAPLSGLLVGGHFSSMNQFALPHEAFKNICNLELAKSRQKEGYQTTLVKLIFNGLNDFLEQKSSQAFVTLSEEISEQITFTIQSSNCLSHESPEVYYFTLFDVSTEQAKELVSNLTGRLRQLILDNHSFVFKSVETQLLTLTQSVTTEDLSVFLSNW